MEIEILHVKMMMEEMESEREAKERKRAGGEWLMRRGAGYKAF